MIADIWNELQQRCLLSQVSHPQELAKGLTAERLSFYLGIDPTAASMHCGHLVPLLLARRLQQAGHRPLIVVGGGTAMIGDPSGKDEMRKLLTAEQVRANVTALTQQVGRFVELSEPEGLLLNNADWLASLEYIPFLRDIGRHFSVNRMLSFETYKNRLATGLSFIEFNYQLLQSYDFLQLYRRYGCRLQIGGDDQWGNMVAGIELIRRVEQAEVQAVTVPLVLRSDGKKMGKSEGGAIFLDPDLTSPYDFYQYWRNSSDADTGRFLLMYTFLPLDECQRLGALKDRQLNEAKRELAVQMCAMVHGEDEARRAQKAAEAVFVGGGSAGARAAIPGTTLSRQRLEQGIEALSLFCEAKLVSSRREGRRLFAQGGAWVGERRLKDDEELLTSADLSAGTAGDELLLRAGKKRYFRYALED